MLGAFLKAAQRRLRKNACWATRSFYVFKGIPRRGAPRNDNVRRAVKLQVLEQSRVFPQSLKFGSDTGLLASKVFRQPLTSLRHRIYAKRCGQVAAIALLSVVFLGAGDDMEARFNNLGHHKLICPCGCNQILLECNHVGCSYSDTMRAELMNGLRRGDNDDLVLQAFVQKYGPTVLAAPTTTGFNRIAWIMPFAVLAAGFAFAALIVTSWKNRPLLEPQTSKSSGSLGEFREQARRETEL